MSIYENKLYSTDIKVITNKFAKQSTSAVMYSQNGCTMLTSIVAKKLESESSFLPLTVNFLEKLSAVGKIPGNYTRREAKPSDYATLCARNIDRPLRPMFPNNYNAEIQIVCSLYEITDDSYPEIAGINSASLCLMLSKKIPFENFVAAVNVSFIDGEFVINATKSQRHKSILELKIAGTLQEISMVESESFEVSEEIMIDAILFGHNAIKNFIAMQKEIIENEKVEKEQFEIVNEEIDDQILNIFESEIKQAICSTSKEERVMCYEVIKAKMNDIYDDEAHVEKQFKKIEKKFFRNQTLSGIRIDGRKNSEIRSLTSEIDIFKSVHGSSLFSRGETQVISNVTLGIKKDGLTFDGIEPVDHKDFFLHYNFPSFSVGEARRIGPPNRREIGHGMLAEKALSKVIPAYSDFPYAIRVVADVLESNGSSSQASICSASLALMAAGVPISKHVAGVAMGLVKEGEEFIVLTDIQGLEDHYGDMDFKVAGTRDGICAMQMDMKIAGVTRELLNVALKEAKFARLKILDQMYECISVHRAEVSENAPKIVQLKIKKEKIRDVIGRGGETINNIIEKTDVKIDISEEGDIVIFGRNSEMIIIAQKMILEKSKIFKVGEVYEGKVMRIEKFGAFVELLDFNKEALLHVSKLSSEHVENIEDILVMHQIINVEIIEVDIKNKIRVKLLGELNG